MAFRIDIPWEQPHDLAADLCPFQACFEINSESGDYEPDRGMLELWEKYQSRHTEHVKKFAKRLVALYRGVTWSPGMPYSPDLPKREILKLTKRATVIVYSNEFKGEKYNSLQVRFQLGWDEEHHYALTFDDETETFGSWED
jgi:hypothetical protein